MQASVLRGRGRGKRAQGEPIGPRLKKKKNGFLVRERVLACERKGKKKLSKRLAPFARLHFFSPSPSATSRSLSFFSLSLFTSFLKNDGRRSGPQSRGRSGRGRSDAAGRCCARPQGLAQAGGGDQGEGGVGEREGFGTMVWFRPPPLSINRWGVFLNLARRRVRLFLSVCRVLSAETQRESSLSHRKNEAQKGESGVKQSHFLFPPPLTSSFSCASLSSPSLSLSPLSVFPKTTGPSRRGHLQAQGPQARPGKGPQGPPRGHGRRRRRRRRRLLEKGRRLGRRDVPRRRRQRPRAPPVLPAVVQDLRRSRGVLRLRPSRVRREAERDAAVEEALCPGRR